jgi:hypothetical protein
MTGWHVGGGRVAAEEGDRSRQRRSVRRGIWRGVKFVAGGPVTAVAPDEIASGARLIKRLMQVIRHPRSEECARVSVSDTRTIDVEATAMVYGFTADEVEAQLGRRRRQTAWQAYVTFGLGWLVFAVWLYRAAHTVWTVNAVVTAVEFAPFCAVFFLMSFRCALENYQIRTRRAATAMEYLRTVEEPFWPR